MITPWPGSDYYCAHSNWLNLNPHPLLLYLNPVVLVLTSTSWCSIRDLKTTRRFLLPFVLSQLFGNCRFRNRKFRESILFRSSLCFIVLPRYFWVFLALDLQAHALVLSTRLESQWTYLTSRLFRLKTFSLAGQTSITNIRWRHPGLDHIFRALRLSELLWIFYLWDLPPSIHCFNPFV